MAARCPPHQPRTIHPPVFSPSIPNCSRPHFSPLAFLSFIFRRRTTRLPWGFRGSLAAAPALALFFCLLFYFSLSLSFLFLLFSCNRVRPLFACVCPSRCHFLQRSLPSIRASQPAAGVGRDFGRPLFPSLRQFVGASKRPRSPFGTACRFLLSLCSYYYTHTFDSKLQMDHDFGHNARPAADHELGPRSLLAAKS